MKTNIDELMLSSGVKFGTSGVRGLVVDMTDKVCFSYVSAFLTYLLQSKQVIAGSQVGVAGDLRFSSPRIMTAAAAACETLGFEPVNFGHIPSPALALWGLNKAIPTIMVTGSHIPDERNGIKFNTPKGEILKQDEQGIRAQQVDIDISLFDEHDQLVSSNYLGETHQAAFEYYVERFSNFFPEQALAGQNIGLYEHSAVGRDVYKVILEKLGAQVIALGRSDEFISVDTEAIRPEDVELAKQWAAEYEFDAIVSTDGDSDRPLISDENGNWLRGDIAGILCAQFLNADIVVTPVSSNSAVEKCGDFKQVHRTRIGSPYVIAAMQEAAESEKSVVGYEANGGFLQETEITRDGKHLAALPTRDAVIGPLTILLSAKQRQCSISSLLTTLPQRYTFSDRIKNFPTELGQEVLAKMTAADAQTNYQMIASYFPELANAVSIDTTDGVRITLETDDVVHLRPSGNAPELRCYTESSSEFQAETLNKQCIEIMNSWKSN